MAKKKPKKPKPTKKPEYQDVIKDHATALVAGMLAEAKALTTLEHQVTAGTYRELLIGGLLEHFLPSYLSISTGIIVNSMGERHRSQSNQSDIILYDNRVLPPFLKKHNLGLVPVESVVAVIEVKKKLRQRELANAVKAANRTNYEICTGLPIALAVFAFEGKGPRGVQGSIQKAGQWLDKNVRSLQFIVVAGAFSALLMAKWDKSGHLVGDEWRLGKADPTTHE